MNMFEHAQEIHALMKVFEHEQLSMYNECTIVRAFVE